MKYKKKKTRKVQSSYAGDGKKNYVVGAAQQ